MKKMRIGYFADGPWSHDALARILADETIEVEFICARDDNPDEILESISQRYGIEFFTHPQINSQEFFDLVSNFDCDLFVSMSFNQIFKSRLINLPVLKVINCHAGKLPFYRGRNVLNWVLINDESEFGITVHFIDEGIDTGDIILQRTFQIDDTDDYSTLLSTAYVECGSILYDALKIVQGGNVSTVKQVELDPVGSYCTARSQGDEKLEWNMNSREVFNFVRAICNPGPQARTSLDGLEVKINRVELLPKAPIHSGVAGSVVVVEDETFFVKTLDSSIRVVDWTGCGLPAIGDRFK